MRVRANPSYNAKPELLDKMKQHFETSNHFNDIHEPIVYLEKPSFYFISSDYKTFLAANMNYLAKYVLADLAKIIIEIAESYEIVKETVKEVNEQMAKLFKSKLCQIVNKKSLLSFSALFGITNSNAILEAIIRSVNNVSKKLNFSSLKGIFTSIWGLMTSHPLVFGLIGLAIGINWCFTKEKLDRERIENYSSVIEFIINEMVFNQQNVLKSNVFISCFDERNFYCILPTSYHRRNDGSVSEFRFIRDLKNAPRACEIDHGELFRLLSEIYPKIFQDNQVDIQNLKHYLEKIQWYIKEHKEKNKKET